MRSRLGLLLAKMLRPAPPMHLSNKILAKMCGPAPRTAPVEQNASHPRVLLQQEGQHAAHAATNVQDRLVGVLRPVVVLLGPAWVKDESVD